MRVCLSNFVYTIPCEIREKSIYNISLAMFMCAYVHVFVCVNYVYTSPIWSVCRCWKCEWIAWVWSFRSLRPRARTRLCGNIQVFVREYACARLLLFLTMYVCVCIWVRVRQQFTPECVLIRSYIINSRISFTQSTAICIIFLYCAEYNNFTWFKRNKDELAHTRTHYHPPTSDKSIIWMDNVIDWSGAIDLPP